MLRSIYRLVCGESASFANGLWTTGSRPRPLIKRTGKKQRNYSGIIKLLETSPSRGLPWEGLLWSLWSLSCCISLDCLLRPRLPPSEESSMCLCGLFAAVICSSTQSQSLGPEYVFVCQQTGDILLFFILHPEVIHLPFQYKNSRTFMKYNMNLQVKANATFSQSYCWGRHSLTTLTTHKYPSGSQLTFFGEKSSIYSVLIRLLYMKSPFHSGLPISDYIVFHTSTGLEK